MGIRLGTSKGESGFILVIFGLKNFGYPGQIEKFKTAHPKLQRPLLRHWIKLVLGMGPPIPKKENYIHVLIRNIKGRSKSL